MDPAALRIIDANLNRAREALRVIEDYARFAHDDADAAAAVKQWRHGLRSITEAVGADPLLAARDILTDVGREIKTEREAHRAGGNDVLRAAFARWQEALRCISEFAKLGTPIAVQLAEQQRYAAYELEQRLLLRGDLRRRLRSVRLYVLITEQLCRGDWVMAAEAALRGGAGCLQLREKDLTDAKLLEHARRLRDLTHSHHALLVINDRPDIARLCDADGVHIGQDDMSVAEARRIVGGDRLIGKSTHTPEQFAAALAETPDYLAVGPIYPTTTKPQPRIAGCDFLRFARAQTELPVVAIGGITSVTASSVFAAGADTIAVCSAVIAAEDVTTAACACMQS